VILDGIVRAPRQKRRYTCPLFACVAMQNSLNVSKCIVVAERGTGMGERRKWKEKQGMVRVRSPLALGIDNSGDTMRDHMRSAHHLIERRRQSARGGTERGKEIRKGDGERMVERGFVPWTRVAWMIVQSSSRLHSSFRMSGFTVKIVFWSARDT
jgi:hypothetical protein